VKTPIKKMRIPSFRIFLRDSRGLVLAISMPKMKGVKPLNTGELCEKFVKREITLRQAMEMWRNLLLSRAINTRQTDKYISIDKDHRGGVGLIKIMLTRERL